jgi:hypothetical protein
LHRNSTAPLTLAPQVIKLRAFVSALNWTEVFPLLDALEPALGLAFPEPEPKLKPKSQNTPPDVPSTKAKLPSPSQNAVSSIPLKSVLHASLELHILALGVLVHVQAGRSADASKRITRLHTVLDSGVLDREGIRDGVIEVRVPVIRFLP